MAIRRMPLNFLEGNALNKPLAKSVIICISPDTVSVPAVVYSFSIYSIDRKSLLEIYTDL